MIWYKLLLHGNKRFNIYHSRNSHSGSIAQDIHVAAACNRSSAYSILYLHVSSGTLLINLAGL
jgi:hypothetical protein